MWTCPKCGREFKRANQSHYCGSPPKTVDEYIDRQDPALRPVLLRLRDTIRAAIPEAEETVAWWMPTWRRKGNLIHFAAGKNAVSVYIGEEAAEHFREALSGAETRNGTVYIKPGQAVPAELIGEISRWSYDRDTGPRGAIEQ